MILTIQPNFKFAVNVDGTGFSLTTAYSGHYARLVVGGVSLNFDDRNNRKATDVAYCVPTIELPELTNDPVRLNGLSCTGPGSAMGSAAEHLLWALATDLGYRVEKIE